MRTCPIVRGVPESSDDSGHSQELGGSSHPAARQRGRGGSFREAAERARDAADLAAPELGKKSAKARIKCFAEVEGLIVKYQNGVATGEFLRRIGSVPELQLGDTGTPMVCSFPWRK
jgi:hypothetical protein